jgi:hypothetical protein
VIDPYQSGEEIDRLTPPALAHIVEKRTAFARDAGAETLRHSGVEMAKPNRRRFTFLARGTGKKLTDVCGNDAH